MRNRDLLARYGLKYNPFLPAIPPEDIWVPDAAEAFFFRVETLVLDGGFAAIEGDPGMGKSKLLQALGHRLAQASDDMVIGVMGRPQSKLGDFYRELGDLFGVDLSPSNRYGGFKALRARWRDYIRSNLLRPILLVDEAQEVPAACLNEMRILGSINFDSESLLTTVLAADMRLRERFRSRDLLPLGSRVRTRLMLAPLRPDELLTFLEHLLNRAGAPQLITDELKHTLCQHSAGNPRILTQTAAELLDVAARRDKARLDESLFLEVFGRHVAQPKQRKAG